MSNLLTYPAVRLFVERAGAVQPGFALTPTNARQVAEICARVDGLPLAVELAAARVASLSLEHVLDRLDDGFRLLTGGSRTAPRRQQTMQATLDWSHDQLTAAEQVTFRRLSVFAGGWSLEAAEAICTDDCVPGSDVLELLARLVDKSLVVMEDRAGRSLYRFLEPVRQYAFDRLTASGERDETRRRHAEYFLGFGEARERATSIGGPERFPATEALSQEYANIRLALGWSREFGQAQMGLRLARTVQFFWQARGYPSEGLAWIEQLLALPGAYEPTPASVVQQCDSFEIAHPRAGIDSKTNAGPL